MYRNLGKNCSVQYFEQTVFVRKKEIRNIQIYGKITSVVWTRGH